ncbi:hypothetical protein EMPS_00409 [Entomortierella parvispora]|uniref:F-box domain-containing protein n=1 Tax=Entomortierella parvispora TaxID=205924 RepID=A0A9P3LRL5_9FUNG|nr:hypothetical protein EMPS_00409 [Entomortierella parvispora]
MSSSTDNTLNEGSKRPTYIAKHDEDHQIQEDRDYSISKRSRAPTLKQRTVTATKTKNSAKRRPATKRPTPMVTRSTGKIQPPALETPPQSILQRIPPGVWHKILDYLPVSHVPALSLSSRFMLHICQTWPAWKDFCETNDLGKPKGRLDQAYMALVCTESYYMCDQCHSRTTGTKPFMPQEIPLPVHHFGDRAHLWRLCWACRVDYYKRYLPPLLTIDPRKVATVNWLESNLHLTEKDLEEGLDYFYEPDQEQLANFGGYFLDKDKVSRGGCIYPSGLKLYNKAKAMQLAIDKFGGAVGLNAVRKQTALQVERDYDLRKHQYSMLCWSSIFKKK